MRHGLVPLLLALLLGGLACGGEAPATLRLGFDTQALTELGVLSVQVQPFGPQDAMGAKTQCQGLLDAYLDPSGFLPVGPVQTAEVGTDPAVTVTVPELPPGLVFILAVGFDQPAGGGSAVAAGCGTGAIRQGEKTVIVVAMEPKP
ncbi:MAG: hypothetical protein D6729_17815 [Deltaproteobacteria bacterium]|nr:MAG: hypothetical protein D6729_17815 [Deltaproteobacteria bacterium]